VKIIHQLHSSQQQPPELDNLLIEFQTFLVDKKLKAEINQKQIIITKRNDSDSYNTNNIIPYVEKLQSIPDHRKFAISLMLTPYFVNIQNL
jgi:hypothetical protein